MAAEQNVPVAQDGRTEPADLAVRERLIACATELFIRKGYAATTVREIVEAAGVTKPALYYYFRNKEGIFLELMRGPFELFGQVVGASVGESGTARERMARLFERTYGLFVANLDVARLLYASYYGPPQGAPFIDVDTLHTRFQEAVRALVEEGIASGEFRNGNVSDMMWAIIGAVNIAMEIELCHPEQSLGTDGVRRVLDLVFDGIAAGKEMREGEGR